MPDDIEPTSTDLNRFKKYRMYRCADCHQSQRCYLGKRYRAKRLQCSYCGSYYLDPSESAKAEEIYKNQRRIKASHLRPPRP